MARIYQKRISDTQRLKVADVERPEAQRVLVKFWLCVIGIVVASLIFYLLARRVMISQTALMVALGAAVGALVLLVVMSQALRRLKLVSRQDVEGTRYVKRNLAQLDNRFSIFPDARIEGVNVDHLIIGPTGVFALNARFTLVSGKLPNKVDLEDIRTASERATELMRSVMPATTLSCEPVLCMIGEKNPKVRRTDEGVWIVPAERIVAALLKRSNREGAITQGVNETGAFSSDTLQTAALEQALARHWDLSPEKNYTEFLSPAPELQQA